MDDRESTTVHRLERGATSFDDLGAHTGRTFPAGNGIWEESVDDPAVRFFSSETATLAIDVGGLVQGVDDAGIYGVRADDPYTLWRFSPDGTERTSWGTAATIATVDGSVRLSYYDGAPTLVAGMSKPSICSGSRRR